MVVDQDVEQRRYTICQQCEHFVHAVKFCNVCKCFMPVKVKLEAVRCPVGKWGESYRSNPDY
jgi:hypothetical protein